METGFSSLCKKKIVLGFCNGIEIESSYFKKWILFKGNKWFKIYDPHGNWLRVIYKNQSEIIAIEPANFDKNLIDEYFKLRNIN